MISKKYDQLINRAIYEHPGLQHAAEIAEICAPLKNLGIAYFSHVHISKDNEFTGISNSPAFHELYLSKHHFNFDYFPEDNITNEQYLLWDYVPLDPGTLAMEDDFNALQFGHTFSIMLPTTNGQDCYHFAGRLGDESINGKYLVMLDALKKFINYFKDKTLNNPELAKTYDLKIPLNMRDKNFNVPASVDLTEFKDMIQSDRIYHLSKNKYLTSREMNCLYWLSNGKTFDETGMILGISARTVKAHIEAVKTKTDCQNLFQLGMIFSNIANLSK